ncbi:dimethylarginine dimethylaminohydrolase family protein [Nonlabens marinus]|nr:arginine deiminase family protein [Nonlabens marinus]
MKKLDLHVQNETSRLRAVVLGTARSNGPVPDLKDAYDPKSREHIIAGTYPKNEDMVVEMEALAAVFEKYQVEVFRPKQIEDCNQIFTRDIGFVIDDIFVKANILPDREEELEAIKYMLDQVDPEKVIRPPEEVHIEGGDVMLYNDYIFVGTYRGEDYADYIIARTNVEGVEWVKKTFPHKKVVSFNLRKDNLDPYNNALHLDCCFQPVGVDKCIIYKGGFLQEEEYQFLVDLFGKENCFEITQQEMYEMNSNIFSIAPDVVVSERNFTRLNTWLRSHGITVEEVPYAEIAKQEGLLRCSTLPLIRD